MSNTGKQNPLGVNALGSVLQNTGLTINQQVPQYVGTSHTFADYTPGSIVTNTCLSKLTDAIYQAYTLGVMSESTYDNLISIGASSIPALGNSKPPTYTYHGATNTGDPTSSTAQRNQWLNSSGQYVRAASTNYNPAITQHGFVRLIALQAWNEFNWNSTSVDYKEFVTSFSMAQSYISYSNSAINTVAQSLGFLKGTYSNMDDLISGDISGVSLSTKVFGQDLIASGKVIDTKTVASFGLPSNLLLTLNKNTAITQSVSIALIASGLTPSEVNQITAGAPATIEQEQKIYAAFLIIIGVDLADVLIPLNCKTQGLTTLADLLNPIKLFPNSYQTLTVPLYNSTTLPTNSKTYYPIYSASGIHASITSPGVKAQVGNLSIPGAPQSSDVTVSDQVLPEGFGSYLVGILPNDVAQGAGAFSVSMRQIKNINAIPIEKLAQVVANIETTAGLNQVAGTDVPTNTTLATQALTAMALGSGPNGSFTFSDFFGAMSCLPYPVAIIYSNIQQLQTSTLSTIYQNLYDAVVDTISYSDSVVQGFIDQANAEIESILSKHPTVSNNLNTAWNQIGTQLSIEQRARYNGIIAVPVPATALGAFPTSLVGFVDLVPALAIDTEPNMGAQTLEAISDTATPGGQSLVAMCRQERNKARLQEVGIHLDNNIPESTPLQIKTVLANGGPTPTTLAVTLASPETGQDTTVVPVPSGYFDPVGNAYMVATMVSTGDVTAPFVPSGPGAPLDVGQADVPGSLAGSPYQNLIPPDLSTSFTSGILSPATLSVPDAIEQVVRCNCDCWMQ